MFVVFDVVAVVAVVIRLLLSMLLLSAGTLSNSKCNQAPDVVVTYSSDVVVT